MARISKVAAELLWSTALGASSSEPITYTWTSSRSNRGISSLDTISSGTLIWRLEGSESVLELILNLFQLPVD